jgi:hypothetical protein
MNGIEGTALLVLAVWLGAGLLVPVLWYRDGRIDTRWRLRREKEASIVRAVISAQDRLLSQCGLTWDDVVRQEMQHQAAMREVMELGRQVGLRARLMRLEETVNSIPEKETK